LKTVERKEEGDRISGKERERQTDRGVFEKIRVCGDLKEWRCRHVGSL
jgi:hypothetical protein